MIVDGQVLGGVAQGIGTALYEEMPFDTNGQPLATTLADYMLPGATEIPVLRIDHMESPSPYTEFGQKGIGEGGAIGPPAAIANAINDALRPLGARVDQLPITPASRTGSHSSRQAHTMKPATFSLTRPANLAEALAALDQPNTRIIAGGQSLGPMLNLRLARPAPSRRHRVAARTQRRIGHAGRDHPGRLHHPRRHRRRPHAGLGRQHPGPRRRKYRLPSGAGTAERSAEASATPTWPPTGSAC